MTSLTLAAHEAALLLAGALDDVPAPEDVRPGWIALGSFLLLAFVTVLLWLSMRKQLGKIRFDEEDGSGDEPSAPQGHAENGEPAENGDQRS
jgi:hypothetical protein